MSAAQHDTYACKFHFLLNDLFYSSQLFCFMCTCFVQGTRYCKHFILMYLSAWFSKNMPIDLNHFIHVTCNIFLLITAACKAYLDWNVANCLLHVSFILLFYLSKPHPTPLFSIGVKFSPVYWAKLNTNCTNIIMN